MKLAREIFKVLLGKRLPNLDGELTTDGNDSVINITRDDFGIPYIKAASTSDGWYGLGFCQGQDRSFQLELSQRIATGTLSEVIGPEALPIDRISRRIGFHRSSVTQFNNLDSETQKQVQIANKGLINKLNGYSYLLKHTKPSRKA